VDLSIAEAAALIRERKLSPVELTDAQLSRISDLNAIYNAYITVTYDRAMADAKRAENEIMAGSYRGPLHGIPIALKDIVSTSGIRTTCGSMIGREWIPDTDAHVARKLADAGTVLLGKLNAHEFAMGGTNDNPHYGPARNPWDLTRISGGSSGGSGVATTARLAMGTIGTDTGGSIRIPASLCGCVGFKPTYGRVSKAGVFPLSSMRDHVGPLTRTVEDSALVLQAIAGYDPQDANSVNVPTGDYTTTLADGIAATRVGVPGGRFTANASSDVLNAVAAAIDVISELGATVVPLDMQLPTDDYTVITLVMFAVEAKYYHRQYLSERIAEYGTDLQERFRAADPDCASIGAALDASESMRVAFQEALETVDILVTPTVPFTAPNLGADDLSVDGRDFSIRDLGLFTYPMNYARVPALAVPCGFSDDGLPIGLTFTGRHFDEATVLRVGYAYERATEWRAVRPPEAGGAPEPRR
jgi:aspartyl-tRNA(Asn)/glutamyl-tRNA(Gln) amidotransferase subunit A